MDRTPTLAAVRHGTREEVEFTRRLLPPETLHFNAGVLLWRKGEESRRQFEAWHVEWLRFGDIDQLALVRAIAETGVPVTQLPGRFNRQPRQPQHDAALRHLCTEKEERFDAEFPDLMGRARALVPHFPQWLRRVLAGAGSHID